MPADVDVTEQDTLVEIAEGVHAAAVAEDAYVLKDGAIAYSGSAPGLINDPEVLASYLGG